MAAQGNHYDYIIAGGGAAGLSLACRLVQSPLKDSTILIIDQDAKQRNDRTWCFWTTAPTLFDRAVYRAWEQVRFTAPGFARTYPLSPYQYKLIRGIDFYQEARRQLAGFANITFLQGHIARIEDGETSARVLVGGEVYTGAWIFDSLFQANAPGRDPQHYHYLKQHFTGWEIETSSPSFNPELPTLFDFNTPQKDCLTFFYILPFSPQRALVEYTLFSSDVLRQADYDQALRKYLAENLGLAQYRILEVEHGVIPMSDQPQPRRLGQRILAIGTKGGRVKPSSGYAFMRIQQDTEAAVQSLVRTGHPFAILPGSRRYHLFDQIMLQLMYRKGKSMASIFTCLFQRNPIQRIFRFLDEEAPLSENVQLMATLPVPTFVGALLKLKLLHRI